MAAGVGLGLAPAAVSGDDRPPRVRRRAILGRTGLEVPDIGFGASRLAGDPGLVRHALDRGVTYFDSAESYQGGSSETTLGEALRGRRDEVILTSKTKGGGRSTRAQLMAAREGSLRRLRTDRIDIYFNHAVNDPERLRNPEWSEFVERAKAQGKIRFTGMSGHGGRLVECLEQALDQDLFDVFLVAHNFGQDPAFYESLTRGFDFVATQPDLPRVLARAKRQKVGVVAMKTLRGGRLNDLRPYETGGSTFAQAAFRWTLSNPSVDSLVVSMKSREMIDEYLGASGWERPRAGDRRLLARYEAEQGRIQCRYGCNACASACPREVEIPEVLRTRMYAEDYEDLALAREDYARLGEAAAPCASCSHQRCLDACPSGIPIAELTRRTHRRLAG